MNIEQLDMATDRAELIERLVATESKLLDAYVERLHEAQQAWRDYERARDFTAAHFPKT
jgi:hypothetical protein